MGAKSIISRNFAEHKQITDQLDDVCGEAVAQIGDLLVDSLKNEGCIFWCGNGGSAADSQHLAAELVGRFNNDRRALRSIALSTDTSVITSVANDFGYDDIFSRQIEGLGRKGDVLVGMTTSGNSENILRVFKAAKSMGVKTVALLGKGGGKAIEMADITLVVPTDSTARIQESHILIGHILCELIEEGLGID
ncbi:MAG: D-sedoheptulose 7-phosphate isomerase [Rhodospirillaceae bacterium]|nr:D-sedoheptulose 7-phosphate isomerase [Rhodospirillaceae bacterium]